MFQITTKNEEKQRFKRTNLNAKLYNEAQIALKPSIFLNE